MADNADDEAWYRERDDRSNLVQSWDVTLTPLIVVAPELARTRDGQITLEVLVNIIARFMRTAVIVLAEQPSILHPHDSLRDVLVAAAHDAEPRFKLDFVAEPPHDWHAGPTTGLGRIEDARMHKIIPLAGGVAHSPPAHALPADEAPDVVGAIVTACFAARDVFFAASALEELRPRKPYTYRAMQNPLRATNLGNVHLIGAGGVGCNIVYFLPFLPITAEFVIIDHDTVGASNLNRCLLFTNAHARDDARKAAVAAAFLEDHGARATPAPMTYAKYIQDHGRGNPDVVFMMANEEEVWNTLQNNFPPLTYSAATSANWGVHTARHEPLSDACVSCLMGLHENATAPMGCDTGQVGPPENKRLGVLPFIAPLAAVLTLAHVLDDAVAPKESANLRLTDAGVPYPRMRASRLGKRTGCACSAQDPEIYRTILDSEG